MEMSKYQPLMIMLCAASFSPKSMPKNVSGGTKNNKEKKIIPVRNIASDNRTKQED